MLPPHCHLRVIALSPRFQWAGSGGNSQTWPPLLKTLTQSPLRCGGVGGWGVATEWRYWPLLRLNIFHKFVYCLNFFLGPGGFIGSGICILFHWKLSSYCPAGSFFLGMFLFFSITMVCKMNFLFPHEKTGRENCLLCCAFEACVRTCARTWPCW